jgi:hypothetical protein
MAYKQFPVEQATKGFLVTPSDTVNIKEDAANLEDVAFVYLHAVSGSGAVKVLLAGMADSATAVDLYLIQGVTSPHLVKRLLATPTPPTTVSGVY